jgi:hypothetical protein
VVGQNSKGFEPSDQGLGNPVPQKHCPELHILPALMGKKSVLDVLDVEPQFVRRRLLADLGANAGRFGSEFCGYPWLQREERLLKSTLQAEDPFHRPSEMVAPADADWLSVLEVSA